MFYGVIIRMYCAPAEHEPPHIHVYYQDYNAIVDVQKCEITAGNLPKKQLRMVLAWVEIHQEELLADWTLAQNGDIPFRIEPLR
jgi:uncharacterized protein YdaL